MNVYSILIKFDGYKYGPTTERSTIQATRIDKAIKQAMKLFLDADGDKKIRTERKAAKKSVSVSAEFLRKAELI